MGLLIRPKQTQILRFLGEKVGNFRKKLEISRNKLEISGNKLEISGNWFEICKFLVKNVGNDVKFIGRKILCESLAYAITHYVMDIFTSLFQVPTKLVLKYNMICLT